MGSTVADRFSAMASEYETYWAEVLMPANRQLVAMVPMTRAQWVLDLGGGVGSLVPVLQAAAPQARVVVSDRAEGMVRLARSGHRVVADACRLPFGPSTFDAVFLTFVLQYVEDADAMFRDVARALRPGGSVGVAGWGRLQETRSERIWMAGLDEFGAPPAPEARAVDRAPIDTMVKLDEALTRAGFEHVRTRRLEWSDQPDAERFIDRMTHLGRSRQRLEQWDEQSRQTFVDAMHTRLGALAPDGLRDDSQVLAAVGVIA